MVLKKLFISDTGLDYGLHIHCSGLVEDRALAGRQSSISQYCFTQKMILKRTFIGDKGSNFAHSLLHLLGDRTHLIIYHSFTHTMVLKKLFISDSWEFPWQQSFSVDRIVYLDHGLEKAVLWWHRERLCSVHIIVQSLKRQSSKSCVLAFLRTDFGKFLLWEGVVLQKGLIISISTFRRSDVPARTDIQ